MYNTLLYVIKFNTEMIKLLAIFKTTNNKLKLFNTYLLTYYLH